MATTISRGFALKVFPRCIDRMKRGEGPTCGALARYRIGNCWFCADHRDQGKVYAYPIDGQTHFGYPESAQFRDLCKVMGFAVERDCERDLAERGRASW